MITIQFTVTVMVSLGFSFSLLDGISFVSLAMCINSIGWIVILNYVLSLAMTISERSEKLLFSWKSKQYNMSPFMKKTIKSLRPCRIYCGSQYFIDARVICQINNIIPNNTVSNVLMFKELKDI